MASITQKLRQIMSDISNADRRLMDVRTGYATSASERRAAERAAIHTPRNS